MVFISLWLIRETSDDIRSLVCVSKTYNLEAERPNAVLMIKKEENKWIKYEK